MMKKMQYKCKNVNCQSSFMSIGDLQTHKKLKHDDTLVGKPKHLDRDEKPDE